MSISWSTCVCLSAGDLPAVPHRSTLSVCSKALLLNWDSLLVETGNKQRDQWRSSAGVQASRSSLNQRTLDPLQPLLPPAGCYFWPSASPVTRRGGSAALDGRGRRYVHSRKERTMFIWDSTNSD